MKYTGHILLAACVVVVALNMVTSFTWWRVGQEWGRIRLAHEVSAQCGVTQKGEAVR